MTDFTLVLDFDGTITTCEGLDELALIALADAPDRRQRVAEIAAITEAGMRGELDFGHSLTQRLELLRARPEHVTALVDRLRRHVTPSVRRRSEWLRAHAANVYVISGGFQEFIEPVVAELGIPRDHVLANTFTIGPDGYFDGCDPANPLAIDGGKSVVLQELPQRGRVIMVGDGFSDVQVRDSGAADRFVAFVENVRRLQVTRPADAVADDFDDVIAYAESAEEPARSAR